MSRFWRVGLRAAATGGGRKVLFLVHCAYNYTQFLVDLFTPYGFSGAKYIQHVTKQQETVEQNNQQTTCPVSKHGRPSMGPENVWEFQVGYAHHELAHSLTVPRWM